MKRKINNKSSNTAKKKKKSKGKLNYWDYYLPHNTGLIYKKIVGYRVIYGNNENDYISDFNTLKESRDFINRLEFIDFNYLVIRAIVFQELIYLESENGNVIDSKTNKSYICIKKERFCEWDLDKLNYVPHLQL